MAGQGILDSTFVSRTSNLRDSVCDQDLRKLTRMRRHGNVIYDSKLGEDRVDEQFGVAAAFCSARLGPVAGRQSPDYAEERAQWRSSCSVILSQWALQMEGSKPAEQSEKGSVDSQAQHMEEPKPVVLLEKDGADSQAVIGFGSRRRSGSIVPGDLLSLPRPLSLTDLAIAPTHGSPVRVAYQGVPGAYSELAALKAYPECEAVPCEQFEAAFKAVELWLVDRAVLPIENSLGGSIHRNYDLLLRHRLHIVGEVQIPVNHCLLGLPGVRKEELRRVLSHRQALSQCKGSLSRLGVIREEVDDTASAAQYLAQNNLRDTGAVASSRAAEIYSLAILAEGIQDDPDNITRFLMLAREPIIPRTDMPFKTSIVFTLEEGPGVLFKALAVFALRDISLRKIESRPQRKKPLRVVDGSNNGVAKHFDYLFYIDFEASMADPRAQNALGHLQEFATFLRVLGSYPTDTTSLRRSSTS